jgi:hypothetical protein
MDEAKLLELSATWETAGQAMERIPDQLYPQLSAEQKVDVQAVGRAAIELNAAHRAVLTAWLELKREAAPGLQATMDELETRHGF